MAPRKSEKEKAALGAASRFDWRMFGIQFAVYATFITATGLVRWWLGQLNGFIGFLAWETVYVPMVAVLALVLAYRRAD